MDLFLHRYRNLTVLVVVIAAQLVLLAYQVRSSNDVRLIRVWAITAVSPFARILEGMRGSSVGFVRDYINLVDVREQNRRLQEELGKLKLDNQFLRSELNTAERAQALAAFQARTPSRTIAARIIGTGTGSNSQTVLVDRGTTHGLQRGMAAVTPDGIAGKVLAAYPLAAHVMLITDPNFAAGVISQKNRVYGTLKGQGRGSCLVDYVQNEEKVDVGEMFFTSGDDRVFPKGLPVGEVRVVRAGKTFKEIHLVPSGFLRGLEELLIVLETVHQQIPDPRAASTDVYLAPAPPATGAGEAARTPGVFTDADRVKERYKRIGEVLGHTYGEGGPGAKPPNFNIDPNNPPVRPAKPAAAPAKPPAATTPDAGRTAPQPPPPKSEPATPTPSNPPPPASGAAKPAVP